MIFPNQLFSMTLHSLSIIVFKLDIIALLHTVFMLCSNLIARLIPVYQLGMYICTVEQ